MYSEPTSVATTTNVRSASVFAGANVRRFPDASSHSMVSVKHAGGVRRGGAVFPPQLCAVHTIYRHGRPFGKQHHQRRMFADPIDRRQTQHCVVCHRAILLSASELCTHHSIVDILSMSHATTFLITTDTSHCRSRSAHIWFPSSLAVPMQHAFCRHPPSEVNVHTCIVRRSSAGRSYIRLANPQCARAMLLSEEPATAVADVLVWADSPPSISTHESAACVATSSCW